MYDNQKTWGGSRVFNFEDMFQRRAKQLAEERKKALNEKREHDIESA